MEKSTISFLFFLVLILNASAMDPEDVIMLSADKPLWTLGYENADWLIPKKNENCIEFALFSFSVKKKGIPKEGIEQAEDDIGRLTRSLPLFLGERINIETNAKATNLNFVLKNVGPIVGGVRSDGESLNNSIQELGPNFIVTGHFQRDHLETRNVLTIYVYDVKAGTEQKFIEVAEFFSSDVNIAEKAARQFLIKIGNLGVSKENFQRYSYPRPSSDLFSPYLDGIGQLFIQSLVENGHTKKETIWGEERMLDWYKKLWIYLPKADSTKLMFFKGYFSSQFYQGSAYPAFTADVNRYLSTTADLNDPIFMLSPLFFRRMGDEQRYENARTTLLKLSDKQYQAWLKRVDKSKLPEQ